MEEIFEENPQEIPAEEKAGTAEKVKGKTKVSWKEWLGTEEAVRWVYLIFGFFAIILVMVFLQFSTKAVCCGDWDGYYHIRWSSLLWENFSQGKWLPEFKWLPLTVLNPNDYADHHFLFHLLQIPFLWFFEPVMAAKVATVFYGSLAIFSVYWLMFRYKIDYLLLWFGALMTCANPFFYRMNMGKAPPLTIIYTVIGIYLLFERKYKWLLPLMFVFVWTYSLFPLLLIAAVIWAGIIAWNEREFEWQPVAYTFGGMVLGNLINPYFPNNFKLFWEHFVTKATSVSSEFQVPVGGEWYPYEGWQLLTHLTIAFAAMLMGYILFRPQNGKLPEKATFFLVFASILFLWMFKSKRIAEYFPPFAILFAAFSWQAFLAFKPQLPEDFKRDIEPFLDKDKDLEEKTRFWKNLAAGGIGAFFALLMFYLFVGVDTTNWVSENWRNRVGLRMLFSIKQEGLFSSIGSNEANDKYKRAMDWAKENIPEGERIFNANWDDFPKLFFFNTKHSYVYGLDPNYLYSENPDLYKTLTDITSAKIEEAAPFIREKFGANYVFADAKENEDMIAKLLESGWAEMVYEDDEARILKIRDQKGDPPDDTVEDDTPPTAEELKQLEEMENAEKPANNANTPADDGEDDANDGENNADTVETN